MMMLIYNLQVHANVLITAKPSKSSPSREHLGVCFPRCLVSLSIVKQISSALIL